MLSRYFSNWEWRDKLNRKFSHFALGMTDDEMIQANRVGIGGGGLAAVVAGMLGTGALGLAAAWMMRDPPTPAPSTSPASESRSDEAHVRVFWGDEEIRPGETKQADLEE